MAATAAAPPTSATVAAVTPADDAAAAAKAQEFAHRIVEFADFDTCAKFFRDKAVDFDKPSDAGWSVLMRVCACGRSDLIGHVADATTNISCATTPNRTNVLHLAAMSTNPRVMQELVATPERRAKIRAIVDSPNINGDTPLMMACVAKNVDAVRALLTDLRANVSYGNANGMTALMCAARLSLDPSYPDLEELMALSSEILKLLLASDEIHVNASELTAGNTALHFAVLSQNLEGVQALMESVTDVDVSIQNKAGLSPIELGRRVKASKALMACLTKKLKDAELEAARRSRELEEELMQAEVSAAAVAEKKAKKKSSKAKKKSAVSSQLKSDVVASAAAASGVDGPISALPVGETALEPSEPLSTQADDPKPSVHEHGEDDEAWEQVATKKSRRKISIAEEKSAPAPAIQAKFSLPKPSAIASSKSKKKPSTASASVSKSASSPREQAAPAVSAKPQAPVSAPQSISNHSQPADAKPLSASQQQQHQQPPNAQEPTKEPVSTTPASTLSPVSYHKLNAIFHRTFPMADELDIPVESFVIASSSTDIELQPSDDGLSISQLEVLQEAHLKAYHYLNEKKMELTRVLEAQRLEAQFALQHEILHLD